MKKIVFVLTLCCALMACDKTTVDFSYSPASPRAGQTVEFSNLSSGGEEWSWSFGDGASLILKSPSHAYKQPGTYRVTLQVDKKKQLTATKEITIYDTVPTFSCSESEFEIYKDYTFEALVYNPYNYDVTYSWILPANTIYAVVTDSAMNNSTLKLYFTKAMDEAPIWLTVVMNGKTTYIQKSFRVKDRTTNSVLFRTPDGDYRQRIFGERAEIYQPVAADTLLDNEQDTLQIYNRKEFRLSELNALFPGIQGFHIAGRKIYYRANGLWVANLDGAYNVQIDGAECYAMTLDTKDNRIYWANDEGIWYMPFVGSDNNKFVTIPTRLNNMRRVTRIAADYELR